MVRHLTSGHTRFQGQRSWTSLQMTQLNVFSWTQHTTRCLLFLVFMNWLEIDSLHGWANAPLLAKVKNDSCLCVRLLPSARGPWSTHVKRGQSTIRGAWSLFEVDTDVSPGCLVCIVHQPSFKESWRMDSKVEVHGG